jgi:DNA-binding transcriptional regulator YhcF (GntR family)
VRDAFAGRRFFEDSALPSIRALARIYGLEPPTAQGEGGE